jgi:hypothetical protein
MFSKKIKLISKKEMRDLKSGKTSSNTPISVIEYRPGNSQFLFKSK